MYCASICHVHLFFLAINIFVSLQIQVGHEPLPPTLGRNMFGRQVYQLPGLFAYGKIIKELIAYFFPSVAINLSLHLIFNLIFKNSVKCMQFLDLHLFHLAKHIVKIDGKSGLFKGLLPRLCAGTIGTIVHSRVLQVQYACQVLQRFICFDKKWACF